MNMIDIPIGSQFYCNGILLEVALSEVTCIGDFSCAGCYFDDSCKNEGALSCFARDRVDGKHVIFKKVEEK